MKLSLNQRLLAMHLGRAVWAGACTVFLGSAWAQDISVPPSPAMSCLMPEAGQRGTPDYPLEAYQRHLPGRVKVELEFDSPDGRPGVKVLEKEGEPSFVDEVKRHVRSYRLPCLKRQDGLARLIIDFQFRPDDREAAVSEPVDPDEALRQAASKCVAHVSGRKTFEYPRIAASRGEQGRVLVRMNFTAADEAPTFEVFAPPGFRGLIMGVKEWAPGYRMPCYPGKPTQVDIQFNFLLEGEGGYGFKAATFTQFLGSIKGLDKQRVAFDTTRMACPFDVRLHYRQPYLPNSAVQLDSYHAERRELLNWLEAAELDVGKRYAEAFFGDTLTFTVPCMKINLTPKE